MCVCPHLVCGDAPGLSNSWRMGMKRGGIRESRPVESRESRAAEADESFDYKKSSSFKSARDAKEAKAKAKAQRTAL